MQIRTTVSFICLAIVIDASVIWNQRHIHNDGQWHGKGTFKRFRNRVQHEKHGKVGSSFQKQGYGHATIVGPSVHSASTIKLSSYTSGLNVKNHEVNYPAISYSSQFIRQPVQVKTTASVHANNYGVLFNSAQVHGDGHGSDVGPTSHGGVKVEPQDGDAVFLASSAHKSAISKEHYESSFIVASSSHVQKLKHQDNNKIHHEEVLKNKWYDDIGNHRKVLATSVQTYGRGQTAVGRPSSHKVVMVKSRDIGAVIVDPVRKSIASKKQLESSRIASSQTFKASHDSQPKSLVYSHFIIGHSGNDHQHY